MVQQAVHYFDRLEDRIRSRLAHYPILYTFIGGVAIIVFWRGVWITADQLALLVPERFAFFDGIFSIAISMFVLLFTGLFISFFVADKMVLTRMRHEERLVKKTEIEVEEDTDILHDLRRQMKSIEEEIKKIETKLH